jgi:hypothetical protein
MPPLLLGRMITLNLLTILIIAVGALAIFDGVTRLRGRRASSILAIVELVFGVLLILTIFVGFPAPFNQLLFSIVLLVAFIIILVLRGGGKGRGWASVTVIATILDLILVLRLLGVLVIPGVL